MDTVRHVGGVTCSFQGISAIYLTFFLLEQFNKRADFNTSVLLTLNLDWKTKEYHYWYRYYRIGILMLGNNSLTSRPFPPSFGSYEQKVSKWTQFFWFFFGDFTRSNNIGKISSLFLPALLTLRTSVAPLNWVMKPLVLALVFNNTQFFLDKNVRFRTVIVLGWPSSRINSFCKHPLFEIPIKRFDSNIWETGFWRVGTWSWIVWYWWCHCLWNSHFYADKCVWG